MFNKKGFTLIELMVVIVIIGVLAALAIPKFTSASAKAKMSEAPTVMASYENAQLARIAEMGSLGAVGDLVFDSPTDSKWFSYGENGSTAGTYKAVATSAIGAFASGKYVGTKFADATSNPSHVSDAAAAAAKLIPNFVTSGAGTF